MKQSYELQVIARVRTPFGEKFGIPRQAGIIPELSGEVVFEADYRSPEALRGIEGFSHLWLLWCFSQHAGKGWHPTVRPPRLGGNTRLGVFATRSSYRPNPLGMSLVKLDSVEWETPDGPILRVSGLDLLDGTPLFDIKPYLPYADSRPEARTGFVAESEWEPLTVEFSLPLLDKVPVDKREMLLQVLAQDPRPAYQDDPERIYGMTFAGQNIRFTVSGGTLRVEEVTVVRE